MAASMNGYLVSSAPFPLLSSGVLAVGTCGALGFFWVKYKTDFWSAGLSNSPACGLGFEAVNRSQHDDRMFFPPLLLWSCGVLAPVVHRGPVS